MNFQVVFDLRKAFIEHCQVGCEIVIFRRGILNQIEMAQLKEDCIVSSQVVHGMKFKTKSGLSIPPPTIVKQDGMSA